MSAALNIEAGLFCDDDGFVHPITNWLDRDGEECEPGEAITAVAGSEGRWFALTLSDFQD